MAEQKTGNKTKPAPLSYRILTRILSPLLVGYTVKRRLQDADGRYVKQRMGYSYQAIHKSPIWFHCASVGEVTAVAPLITTLHTEYPQLAIIVTTVTPTGARVAEQQLPNAVTHYYLPIDWHGACERFITDIKPCCGLIMETELWPNLYASCANHDVPLTIINGRLTERTLRTGKWLRKAFAFCLDIVEAIHARSKTDAEHFIALGAATDKVDVIGNIKFATPQTQQVVPGNLVNRPYWLAASTHDDEELRLARIQKSLGEGHLLVIAPRHPERRDPIIKQLASLGFKPGSNLAVRSHDHAISKQTQLYLADTLGEMQALMAHAELVFMGGSLVPIGGHNILEPARLGKAIITGPHMANFADETRSFLQQNALIQVSDNNDLLSRLDELLNNETARDALGINAAHLMQDHANIIEDYMEAVKTFCKL